MTFLKTLLIILLVYYGLKIILKYSKPFIMRYLAKKAKERFGQSFGTPPNDFQNEAEGNITIDDSQTDKKKSKNSVGEYVDFEELD